jgi:Uma2 family endonuclease
MSAQAQLEKVLQKKPPFLPQENIPTQYDLPSDKRQFSGSAYGFHAEPATYQFTQFVQTKNEKRLDTALVEQKIVETPPTQNDLPCDDGMPMETERHKKQMDLLIDALAPWLGERGYVGGNMFVYFSLKQLKNQDFKGPDVFVTLGVSNEERKSWVVWEEGKSPDIVIELLSESTAQADKEHKKTVYQNQLKVAEYFWFDPFHPQDWKGWQLNRGFYEELPLKNGGFISQQLGLALAPWRGIYKNVDAIWLRWATIKGNLLLLPEEIETQRAEAEAQRANAAEQRAEVAFEEGEQKKAVETARKMLAKGYELAEIAELTSLSTAELVTLSK